MSALAPACVTMPGISTAVAAQDRAVGTVVSTSVLSVVWRRTLCTSTIGRLAGDRDRLLDAADLQVGVDRRVERTRQLDAVALEGAEPGSVNVTV